MAVAGNVHEKTGILEEGTRHFQIDGFVINQEDALTGVMLKEHLLRSIAG